MKNDQIRRLKKLDAMISNFEKNGLFQMQCHFEKERRKLLNNIRGISIDRRNNETNI